MAGKTIEVAFANQNPQRLSIEVVSKWEPKKVTKTGKVVFFQVDETFVSLSREDFDMIFGIKY